MTRWIPALVTLAGALWSSAAHAEPTTDYTVVEGDTCLGIAIGVLGDRAELAVLHRLNPQLGPMPHTLAPGQILKLPATPQRPDANVARTYNVVELRRAGVDVWSPAAVGAELFRAWRVGARERSNARVVFADRSAIEMRENTVVVIYGASSRTASVTPRRASLETGILRSRLSELDGRTLDVDTVAGQVAVAAGSAVVEVVASGRTLVSNHAGKPARIANKTGTTQIVPGMGADAERGKKPSPPRPLPPAPAWATVPALVTGWAATGASARATWTGAAAAVRYRIELATTSGDVLAQLEVPATTTAIELHRIPAGAYRLAIASVDATGLEGISALTAPIEARLLSLAGEAPAAIPGIVDPAAVPAPRSVPLGSMLATSPDLACTIADRRVFATAGPATIACTRGDARAELAVVVEPVVVGPQAGAALALGQTGALEVTLAPMPPAGALETRSDDSVAIERVERTETGARVHVTPRRHGASTITLALATTAGPVELGQTTLRLDAPSVADAPALSREPRVWLALAGGVALLDQTSAAVGVNVEIDLGPRGAIEGGGVMSDGRGAAQLAVAARHTVGRLTPMLRAGGVIEDTGEAGLFAGVGLRVLATPRIGGYGRVDASRVDGTSVVDVLVGLTVSLDP